MKHIVIGAHGNLAEAFLETVRMIAGTEQTSCIQCHRNEGRRRSMDPQASIKKAEELFDEDRDGECLLAEADLFGASPCNSLLMAFQHCRYRLVTGLNLGMVLEVLFQFDDMSLEEAAEHMVEIGKGGIQNVILPA